MTRDVTHILQRIETGDRQASAELLPLVYEELSKLAAARMAHESKLHTLNPADLIREARDQMVEEKVQPPFLDLQFHIAAAEAMRQILVDHAHRQQRDGQADINQNVAVDNAQLRFTIPPDVVLLIDELVEHLRSLSPDLGELANAFVWAEIESEMIERIAKETAEWTEYSTQDPGKTIMELFGWLSGLKLYQHGQVPKRSREQFLALLQDVLRLRSNNSSTSEHS